MRAGSVLGKIVLAVSRRSAAFDPGHDCGPAVAAELRRQAAAFGGWHEDDVVRAHALRDLFLRRADELDPPGGGDPR